MKKSKIQEFQEESILELLDQQYLDSDNKDELDYWTPISKVILESIELRSKKGLSQTDLAKKMNTRQSVISRFENMGRIPSYDLIARLSFALDHSPGMTLQGDYMAVVPVEKQKMIKEMAEKENIPTKKFVQYLLNQIISNRETISNQQVSINIKTAFSTSADVFISKDMQLNANIHDPVHFSDAQAVPKNVISFPEAI